MKFCPTCKETKEASCFSKNKKKKDLLDWQCKDCFKKKYLLNKYKINYKNYLYYTNNKQLILEKQKIWRSKNKKSILLRNRARRLKLSKYSIIKQKDINNLIIKHNNCCFYCKQILISVHMDHIVPLCKGGEHKIENLVPSCKKCNLSKGSKLITEWIKYDN